MSQGFTVLVGTFLFTLGVVQFSVGLDIESAFSKLQENENLASSRFSTQYPI